MFAPNVATLLNTHAFIKAFPGSGTRLEARLERKWILHIYTDPFALSQQIQRVRKCHISYIAFARKCITVMLRLILTTDDANLSTGSIQYNHDNYVKMALLMWSVFVRKDLSGIQPNICYTKCYFLPRHFSATFMTQLKSMSYFDQRYGLMRLKYTKILASIIHYSAIINLNQTQFPSTNFNTSSTSPVSILDQGQGQVITYHSICGM